MTAGAAIGAAGEADAMDSRRLGRLGGRILFRLDSRIVARFVDRTVARSGGHANPPSGASSAERAPRATQAFVSAASPVASGAKKRSFSSASPNIARISPRRSPGLRRGRFLYCAMISSFFIECSHPTSSVTLT